MWGHASRASIAALLALPAGEVIGRPCHEVVSASDAGGRPFCGPECPAGDRARKGRILPLVQVKIGGIPGSREGRRLRILFIPIRRVGDGALFIVHAVVSSEREVRMEDYLRSVAGRWRSGRQGAPPTKLTARELQVLDLLTADEDLCSIAGSLEVSYSTIRNHVQHILRKLGVHSIEEAVARSLFAGRGGGS